MIRAASIEPLESRIAPATFTVTTLADSGPGSFRDAIEQANVADGADDIVFDVAGTIKLKSDLPTITDDITITGPVAGKAGKLKISGQGQHSILHIDGADASIAHLTVTKGLAEKGGGIFIDAAGKNIALTNVAVVKNTASDQNPGATTFGGGIAIQAGTVMIEGSKISGNVAKGVNQIGGTGGGEGYGGGIWNRGTLTVSDSVISGNKAKGGASKSEGGYGGGAYGGGVYASQGADSTTIQNSTITKNKSIGGRGGAGAAGDAGGSGGNGTGGGLYTWQSVLTVTDTTISKNLAKGGDGGAAGKGSKVGGPSGYGAGGGIASGGTGANVTLENSKVSGNKAFSGTAAKGGDSSVGYGGGIFSTRPLTITDSTISGNKSEYGGGVYSSGSALIQSSTISGNRGTYGGGVNHVAGSLQLLQVTIANNVAKADGGGIYKTGGALQLNNSTVAGNSAQIGGGLFNNASSSAPIVVSSIIAANSAPTDRDVSGLIGATSSLIGKVTSGTAFDTDTGNLKDVNALLGPLQNNGGPTFTMLPKAASPAIDAGSNPFALATDQRGNTRENGAGPDVGAVETP